MKNLRQYIRKILKENYSPSYRYVYHGTSEESGEQIEERGFDTSLVGKKSGDASNKGISFTAEKDIAIEHALWAWSKNGRSSEYGGALVIMRISDLNILPGKDFNNLWDELGSHPAALDQALANGYDAVEYFDFDSGDGIEELEVLIFPHAVEVDDVEYIDPEDHPELTDHY